MSIRRKDDIDYTESLLLGRSFQSRGTAAEINRKVCHQRQCERSEVLIKHGTSAKQTNGPGYRSTMLCIFHNFVLQRWHLPPPKKKLQDRLHVIQGTYIHVFTIVFSCEEPFCMLSFKTDSRVATLIGSLYETSAWLQQRHDTRSILHRELMTAIMHTVPC